MASSILEYLALIIELPNGVLSLHTEQEGRGEVHHVVHTDPVLCTSLIQWLEISWLKTVSDQMGAVSNFNFKI